MKNWIFISLLLFAGLASLAQKNPSYISIRTGVSIPVGDFASINLDKGSFTLTGLNFSLDGAWFFTEHFGVGGQAGLTLHPVDVGALGAAKVEADPFLNDLYIRSESFMSINASIGAYTHWELRNKLSVTAKLLGGFLFANTPYQLYKPSYFIAGPDFYEITSSADHKFIFEPGIGLNYQISSCISIKAEAEFISRTMQFGFYTWEGLQTDSKRISFVNTLLALVIQL